MSIYQQEEQETCACGGSCGCGGHHQEGQVVELTSDEYVVRLEQYLRDLKAEIEVVERELSMLRQVA